MPVFTGYSDSDDHILDKPLRPEIDWPEDYEPIWEEVSPEELEEKWRTETRIIKKMQTHDDVELPRSLFRTIAERATEIFSKDDLFWIELVDVTLVKSAQARVTEVSEPGKDLS